MITDFVRDLSKRLIRTGFMRDLSKRLVRSRLASSYEIKGCSRAQIEEVRALAKHPLPPIYEDFLSTMGRGAGSFERGTDIFYPEVLTNRKAAEDLLEEDQCSFRLSESDFVFSCHQGYQFLYMPLSDSEPDPPVYYYLEGKGPPVKQWDHFSEFLLNMVESYESFFRAK